MASPVSDTYNASSGQSIHAGRWNLPAWVPDIGEIADISLNTMYDVRGADPDPSMQYNYWAGCAYAEDYGQYGSLIFNTGGHTATLTNYVYGYDIESRLHFMEKPSAQHYLAPDLYCADTVTGWLWADSSGTTTQEGETFAYHSYSYMTWVPASGISGGGSAGWLFTPGRASMNAPGQRGTNQAHKFPLGLGQGSATKYQMHGSPVPYSAHHFFAVYDPTRNRVAWFGYDGSSYSRRYLYYMNMSDGSQGQYTWPGTDPAIFPYYAIGKYAQADDLYLIARLTASALELWAFDPVASRLYAVSISGSTPTPPYDCTVEWVESWRALVFFHPGSSTVWTLKAPSNPRSEPWVWGSQSLSGTIRQPSQAVPAYTRLRYVPELDLFTWPAAYTAPMQGFRLARP